MRRLSYIKEKGKNSMDNCINVLIMYLTYDDVMGEIALNIPQGRDLTMNDIVPCGINTPLSECVEYYKEPENVNLFRCLLTQNFQINSKTILKVTEIQGVAVHILL